MRVVNDRDIVSRAFLTNGGLKHHIEATHLDYSTKHWLSTAFDRSKWSEVPMLLASYVPVLDALCDHSMVAYRAHDLDEVQATAVQKGRNDHWVGKNCSTQPLKTSNL